MIDPSTDDTTDAEARQRRRAGRRMAVTTIGPRLGRIVRLFVEGGFGFIKTARGHLAYFDVSDVLTEGLDSLRVGSRVRYEMANSVMPRARRVSPIR